MLMYNKNLSKMKNLTININGKLNTVSVYNKETKKSINLKGEYSFDEYKKLSSVLASDNLIFSLLGISVNYSTDEMKDLTTEELEYVCNSLNRELRDREDEFN